jgi:hypothetical protein
VEAATNLAKALFYLVLKYSDAAILVENDNFYSYSRKKKVLFTVKSVAEI